MDSDSATDSQRITQSRNCISKKVLKVCPASFRVIIAEKHCGCRPSCLLIKWTLLLHNLFPLSFLLPFLKGKQLLLYSVDFLCQRNPSKMMGSTPRGANSFLLELAHIEKEGKMKTVKLFPLTVYSFTLNDYCVSLIPILTIKYFFLSDAETTQVTNGLDKNIKNS